jgi:hypothetical protein
MLRGLGCGVPSAVHSTASQVYRVSCSVDEHYRGPEGQLHSPGKAWWIDDGDDVVLDEATLEAAVTGNLAQPFLQRSEGASPPTELNEPTPERRRQMDPGETRPAPHEEAAAHHENDESEMDHDEGVGGESTQHGG